MCLVLGDVFEIDHDHAQKNRAEKTEGGVGCPDQNSEVEKDSGNSRFHDAEESGSRTALVCNQEFPWYFLASDVDTPIAGGVTSFSTKRKLIVKI
jgi:hypothetical protein